MIEYCLVKVWWECQVLAAEVITINIIIIIMMTLIAVISWHLEVIWRRDFINYDIVKPEADSQGVMRKCNIWLSLLSSPKQCWVKVNISLHRFCVVSDVLCDVVILNHSMARHVIITLRSPGVSMSSPGAAPAPPCGRTGASSAAARMMTRSEALSCPALSDTGVSRHSVEQVMRCPVFINIRLGCWQDDSYRLLTIAISARKVKTLISKRKCWFFL